LNPVDVISYQSFSSNKEVEKRNFVNITYKKLVDLIKNNVNDPTCPNYKSIVGADTKSVQISPSAATSSTTAITIR